MTEVINKSGLQAAHYTKKLLSPAIAALQKIDVQAVRCVENHEKIKTFIGWLESFVSPADIVIDEAQHQYENRPQSLIVAASTRYHSIVAEINREEKTIKLEIDAYNCKAEELRKKNFTAKEIEGLIIYPQDTLDQHEQNIIALKNEYANIEKFNNGAPFYDVSLLDISKLAPYLQHQPTAE